MIINTDGAISAINNVPAGVAPANSAVEITLSGDLNTLTIQTVGTYTGALTLQGTVDGKRWVSLGGAPLQNVNTGVLSSTIPSATQSIYQSNVSGLTKARITALAAVSGSVQVSLSASDSTALMQSGPLPAGSSAIGTVIAQQSATASNGATTTAVNSAASTNAANVKTSAGTLYAICAHNATAADKFVRIYNKASAPTVGTDIPVVVFRVPANSTRVESFGTVGLKMTLGIGHSITNLAPANDATAVAAGDVQLAYEWA